MKNSLLYLTIALILGFTLGMQFDFGNNQSETEKVLPPKQSISQDKTAISVDLTSIEQRLQNEIEARQKLESEVALLSELIENFDHQFNVFSDTEAEKTDDSPNESESSRQDETWFNEQALIDSGMEATQARMLKDFFEQQEMQGLYLRDQSIREAWDREKRRESFQALAEEESAFLEQLDEADYEAYLFASGQPNRVAISSVLESAQAGVAGIQTGDHILRYDNQRIYNGFDLRQATSAGTIGDTVTVEVERDGNVLEFYLERGPLGVRLDSVSIEPQG